MTSGQWTVHTSREQETQYLLADSSWKQLELMALLIRVITASAHLSFSRFIFA